MSGQNLQRIAFRMFIMDSEEERAIGGVRWWIETEEPFQCLATCMEVRAFFMVSFRFETGVGAGSLKLYGDKTLFLRV